MQRSLRKDTAQNVVIGPFVDSSDGVTPETGLTIAQADIRLSKNGGAFAQTANAAGATHLENGFYQIPLATADVDTLKELVLSVQKAGAAPLWVVFKVIPQVVHDALIGDADFLHVDAREVSGAAPETGGDIADAVLQEAVGDHSGVAGSLAAIIGTNLDATVSSRMAATGAERAAIADAILQRNLGGGADGGRTVQDALRALRNRIEIDRSGGTFTVYEEDDSTIAFSGSIATASGNPVSDFDPS